MGLQVLATLTGGEHHLDLAADLLQVLLPSNLADQIDSKAVVAILDDCLRNLAIHCGGRSRPDGVLEGEGRRESRRADALGVAWKSSGLPGKPTMMSVVIAASGMAAARCR